MKAALLLFSSYFPHLVLIFFSYFSHIFPHIFSYFSSYFSLYFSPYFLHIFHYIFLRIRAEREQMNHISSCQNFFAPKVPFIPFRGKYKSFLNLFNSDTRSKRQVLCHFLLLGRMAEKFIGTDGQIFFSYSSKLD